MTELARRTEHWLPDLQAALRGLYGERATAVEAQLLSAIGADERARSNVLAESDVARELAPDWFQQPGRVGYIAYADRFGGTLKGVAERVPYLRELGVDVLHLMSVLRPRAGEDDGGYAIDNYRDVAPSLGTLDDLRALIDTMHDAGLNLVLDLVMNHTSDGHAWAQAAMAGDEEALAHYLTFPDAALPDAFGATLSEVFPDLAPGNFTFVEQLDRWVWTTFNRFQWDLDWSNPTVLVEMSRNVLFLADLGVDVLRLDAVAFTGKRMGTNCQNQPAAHLIAQAMRAVLGIGAPATILLAEAIVAPADLVPYLGRHERERRECDLAYHNQLMVLEWSMLAEGRTTLARTALGRMPAPPQRTGWLTYVRCHDDIGWAIDDTDAATVGGDGQGHRNFLAAFYRGDFPMSFAEGEPFGVNLETGDERTCGGSAALCGISQALRGGDQAALDLGVRRLLALYGLAFGWGGIPMIYMGDEVAHADDTGYRSNPERAHDSRWRQRPHLDDAAVARRHQAGSVESRVWQGVRRLAASRGECPPLHAGGSVRPIWVGDEAVFGWLREHPRHGKLVGLLNATPLTRTLASDTLPELSTAAASTVTDVLDPLDASVRSGRAFSLQPYQVRWLTAESELATSPVSAPAPA
ncbi:alpha-amylase family protein [soil metagenome]